MKTKYKGWDLEVKREKSITGDKILFYSIFDGDLEINSGYSEGEDTLESFMEYLKNIVDYPFDYK